MNDTDNARYEKMNRQKKMTMQTQDLVFIAVFAVLIAVCSWISIPSAIPFTMQTFAVYLALNYLGAKKGTMAVCIYLLLGIIGLPVFANFTSGIGILLGTTGGYMIGWIFSGIVMGIAGKLFGKKLWAQALSMLLGLLTCYTTGTIWFMAVYVKNVGPVGLWTALIWCVFPFLLPDLIKLALALGISKRLKKIGRTM